MKISAQCVLGLFVFAISAQAQQIASIDLTKMAESHTDTEVRQTDKPPNGCEKLLGGGISDGVVLAEQGHPRPEIVVEIRLVSDPTPIIGSESQVEVRLRNSGNEPIHIPWSLDANVIQNGQDPNHLHWEVGDFVVLLNGSMLANRTLSQRLYGSKFSKGSQLTIQPGEWITATIKFKFENAFFPNQQLGIGESHLSVEWQQYARSWDVKDCKGMSGNFKYDYNQTNATVTIRLKSETQNEGRHTKE